MRFWGSSATPESMIRLLIVSRSAMSGDYAARPAVMTREVMAA